MKKIFAIDRIEGIYAVCISDDGQQLDVPCDKLSGLSVNDVFCAEVCENELSDIIPMPDERDRRRARNKERLRAIAMRSREQK